jgi:DNA mismatch repair protein MutS2
VLAVLRGLTDLTRAEHAAIAAAWEMCVAVDDLYARARYACEAGGSVPVLEPAPAPLVVRGGRHPLLIAEGIDVVPFDLWLTGEDELRRAQASTDQRAEPRLTALVISGPNTGGKTVLLKAVGLLAALAQAGIIPPVAEGTRLPIFRRIFADIGDHQSIAASLSTFSAHAGALRGILSEADAGSLVLVDEIGNGTDPAEGGALAGAALRSLVRRRAATIVTTHLAQLKEVAARTPGVENASLEFDAASLTPTYRFLQGVPGRSYGLAVARRLGMPSDVLAEAAALLPEAQRTLETLLADLEAKSQEVERREREAARRETQLAARGRELVERSERVEQQERDVLAQQRQVERTGREQARQFLLEARRRVEEALGLARAAVTEATAKEARRLVEEGVQHEAEALKKLQAEAQEKGWRVTGGTGKGEGGRGNRPATNVQRASEKTVVPSPLPVARPEVDIRGLTTDDAVAALNTAIDGAVVNDLLSLRVIHGKGTGALRATVRALLEKDSRVAGFRLAPAPEGGTGVTIVELKP